MQIIGEKILIKKLIQTTVFGTEDESQKKGEIVQIGKGPWINPPLEVKVGDKVIYTYGTAFDEEHILTTQDNILAIYE